MGLQRTELTEICHATGLLQINNSVSFICRLTINVSINFHTFEWIYVCESLKVYLCMREFAHASLISYVSMFS
jgi:hypothetical protein